MLFNSLEFIFLFLPIVIVIFYLLGSREKYDLAVGWLVVSSFFFYAWWNAYYLGLIFFSIVFNYSSGLLLQQGSFSYRRLLLVFSILVNLLLLGYYKYSNFFVDNLNVLAGMSIQFETVILPLAISFFTFQQIAFLVDSFRYEIREYNFLHYCLFVTFFPQLIAGPIVHHKEMLPQFSLAATYVPQLNRITLGLSIFIIGLFKKVLIADTLGEYATPVFNAAETSVNLTFFEAWGGVLAYTFQIYFDFSGYSDMAFGLAYMFGIVLPINFFSPYKSTNIISFWRKWHITLSRFLRDYVYIQLGGNRKGGIKRYRNLMLTMLVGGIWHGAGWNFLLWGGLHGFYLVVNHAWHFVRSKTVVRAFPSSLFTRFLAFGITFMSVVFSWVFFRSASLEGAENILRGMLGINGAILDYRFAVPLNSLDGIVNFKGIGVGSLSSVWAFVWIALAAIIAFFLPNTYLFFRKQIELPAYVAVDKKTSNQRLKFSYSWYWGVALGVMAAFAVMGLSNKSEFLYYQF